MSKLLVILAVILGIVFLGLAYIYFTTPASSLPGYFPGYEKAVTTHIHYKHGIGLVILGAGSFIFAWFQSGKKKSKSAPSVNKEESGQ